MAIKNGNGVDLYQVMTLTVYFPDGHVCCDLCPALETYARKQCRATGEYLIDTRYLGLRCPLAESGTIPTKSEMKKETLT